MELQQGYLSMELVTSKKKAKASHQEARALQVTCRY